MRCVYFELVEAEGWIGASLGGMERVVSRMRREGQMREKRQTTLIEKSNASWERFRTESSYDIMYAARNRNEACALWRKATAAAASWRTDGEVMQVLSKAGQTY